MFTVVSICHSLITSETECHFIHVWPHEDPVTDMLFKVCLFFACRTTLFFVLEGTLSISTKSTFFLIDTDINKFCGYPFLVSQWHFDKQNFLTWLFNVPISDLSDIYFCVPLKKSLFPSKLWWFHLLLFSGSLIILSFTFRSTISLG